MNEKVARIGVVIQQMAADMNRPSFYDLIVVDHECLTSLTGNELRADLRKWIAPPDPSVNYNAASNTHHDGTAGSQRGALRGRPSQVGEDLVPYYGFTEYVHISSLSE